MTAPKTTADYLRDALDILDHCDEGTDGRCLVHRGEWAEGEAYCEWYIDATAAVRDCDCSSYGGPRRVGSLRASELAAERRFANQRLNPVSALAKTPPPE